MLIERTEYREQASIVTLFDQENVFRYCEFSGFSIDGGHVDGMFVGCTFRDLDWYWGLFNGCVFVNSKFAKCIFRGTAFPDCRFVDCEFIDCQFLEDNLGGKGCTADGARVYGSTAKGCKGAEFLFASVAV
jgi:uncharacterized protein YjbI with pentapeptide repeats